MFCWLKIDPFQNLINRIGFFHMLSRQLLTTKTKPVINPWTPMTWTWLGSGTVNYSVVQEQSRKSDEFMPRLEPLWVKANIPPLGLRGRGSRHAASLCHACEYITSVCLASPFKCLLLCFLSFFFGIKWLLGSAWSRRCWKGLAAALHRAASSSPSTAEVHTQLGLGTNLCI